MKLTARTPLRLHLTAALAALATATVGLGLFPSTSDDDLEEAERALQSAPDDPKLLMAAAEAAFSGDDDDAALWYAELAKLMAGDGREAKAVDKRLKVTSSVMAWSPSMGLPTSIMRMCDGLISS